MRFVCYDGPLEGREIEIASEVLEATTAELIVLDALSVFYVDRANDGYTVIRQGHTSWLYRRDAASPGTLFWEGEE